MGTSTSSKGPGGESPLVPPWADTDNQGPGPTPSPQRFREFRKNLGKFVRAGDQNYLRSALSQYASTATGGSAVGPRRFGAMARAGGALYDVLASVQSGAQSIGINLESLNGRDTDLVISILVEALVPNDGDADRIRVALNEALSECLEGFSEFDFAHITDDMVVQLMLAYVSRCVFGQVVLDSKDAFAKALTPQQAEVAENTLFELVKSATDKHMRPLLAGNPRALGRSQIEAAQISAIKEVWTEWEAYSE